MSRDLLFLLKHDFPDGPGTHFYCRECAEISGFLSYYPKLRHRLDVRYVDFARPRREIVSLVGEDHQSCPLLVLHEDAPAAGDPAAIGVHGSRRFISGAEAIGHYLSDRYQIGRPH